MPKQIDITDRILGDMMPSPLGPQGANPAPVPAPRQVAPISLCQLGPCSHYHELRTMMDAQEPIDGSGADRVYLNLTRTCYPSPGIEIDLSAHPVRTCSLWDPKSEEAITAIGTRRRHVKETPEWKEFTESWPANAADEEE
jgi:hypothetical protein